MDVCRASTVVDFCTATAVFFGGAANAHLRAGRRFRPGRLARSAFADNSKRSPYVPEKVFSDAYGAVRLSFCQPHRKFKTNRIYSVPGTVPIWSNAPDIKFQYCVQISGHCRLHFPEWPSLLSPDLAAKWTTMSTVTFCLAGQQGRLPTRLTPVSVGSKMQSPPRAGASNSATQGARIKRSLPR
jgi:hypothetical protein